MLLVVWVLGALLGSASSKVVHQANGIVSIITELEPDRSPIGLPQAVNRDTRRPLEAYRQAGRGAPLVVYQTEDPPLEEGQFRVRSAKIGIVDPESGFKAVHEAKIQEVPDRKDERRIINSERSEPENEQKPQPASKYEVVYPSRVSEDLGRLSDRNRQSNDNRKTKKGGKYGYQTPRRDDRRQNDENNRPSDNRRPSQDSGQTFRRPDTRGDDFVTNKKRWKSGQYGRYDAQQTNKRPNVRTKTREPNYIPDKTRNELTIVDPNNQRTQKNYSSTSHKRLPDGYAEENERRTESSSNYKTGSSESSNHETPNVPTSSRGVTRSSTRNSPNSIKDKLENSQPVQEASSLYRSDRLGRYNEDIEDDRLYPGGGYISGLNGGYDGGFVKENHFEKDRNKDYTNAHNSAQGGKAHKGHEHEEAYSKGHDEHHGESGEKDYYKGKDGDKKSHLDKSAHHASEHHAKDNEKEADFHKNKGHRKGHKKSGFRSVVHKDEYKNKEEFYDEEHDSGEEQQQGHKAEGHAQNSGGYDKKAHDDSGYHHASRGQEGGHGEGHKYHQQKGHQKNKGHSGHYGHEEKYGKKSGHKEGEIHGHSEFGGGYY